MGNITYKGHHGTNSRIANMIMRTNFTINYKHNGSLGRGIYFFEDDHVLAREYASHRHEGKQVRVIECILEVSQDKIFDTVDSREDVKTFHEYRDEIKEMLLSKGKYNARTKNMNEFDGNIYNYIAKDLNKDLIRANTFTPFLSDRRLRAPQSNVPNGTELCLKKNNYIKSKYIYNENSHEEG